MSTFAFVNGGMSSNWNAIWDADKYDLFEPRFNWTYQMRNAKQVGAARVPWVELWPTSRFASGDSTVALAMLGMDISDAGRFESQSSVSRGMVRPYFIRGQVTSDGNAVPGVTIKGYLTVGDTRMGATATDNNGNYELPTIGIGAAHYIVAYNPGNNQAGTSVNTITPVL